MSLSKNPALVEFLVIAYAFSYLLPAFPFHYVFPPAALAFGALFSAFSATLVHVFAAH